MDKGEESILLGAGATPAPMVPPIQVEHSSYAMKFGLSVTAFMFCSGGMMLVNKQVMLPVAERDTPSPSTAHPLLTPSRPAEPATPTHGLWLCGLKSPGSRLRPPF